MSIEIEATKVEIPSVRAFGSTKYPWEKMEVGDSFFVPEAKTKTLMSACMSRAKKDGRKYVVRAYEKDGVKGAMAWRKA